MSENKKWKNIVNYVNKGIIEANIDYVIEYDSFVCLAKLELKIDLEDAYTFSNLISYFYSKTDFGAILLEDENSLMLFFRDYKIHQAKATLQKMQRDILYMFGIKIEIIGITMIDIDDDIKSLLKRLEEYYIMSKISTNKKIFYGTKYFNFYGNESNFNILQVLFKKINAVKIHNLYQGIPVVDRVGIMAFSEENLIVKIEKNKIPFYLGEDFCFIEHDLIPNIIKANILRVNTTQNSISFNNLQFLDSSPVERSGIRIEPNKNIFASLTYENKYICKGMIVNISENSVVLELKKQQLSNLAMANIGRGYLTFSCQIPTQKSFITTIKTKATIFRLDNENVVITIYPSPVARTKLRSYISMQQTQLLLQLKLKLKEGMKFLN